RIAGAGGVALIEGLADDGIRARARPRLAAVGPRAGAVIVACRAVGPGRAGAVAGAGVAGACVVALVLRGADHGVRAGARAGLAGVAAGARVAVVARGAVGLGRVGAGAGGGVAGAHVVALVLRGADDGVRPPTRPRLAGVAAGASVAVVAGCVVGLRRV